MTGFKTLEDFEKKHNLKSLDKSDYVESKVTMDPEGRENSKNLKMSNEGNAYNHEKH